MTMDGAVAIVGIGCRFPGGVSDVAGFWRLLTEGRDAIAEIPASRIDVARLYDPRPATPGRVMTRWGGFLDDIESFDAGFFSISPREAERLDPQQRMLLEAAWEAFEDAGQDMRRLDGSNTAVYVGQWLSDFEGRLFARPEEVDFEMTTGSGRYAASGRISYALGLHGPSMTLDTACSSSLVAVHLAVRSIRCGESDMALAGGVNVILQPHIHVAYSQSRMMAPDGRCKFGDAHGDGYVRSEGAALVVLKRLDRALSEGDRIYAVVRGSAVNNDGRSSGSMGTPSRVGQEELLRNAYRDAGIAPARAGCIEAHGTGTRAGDPVELGALGAVLGGRDTGPAWVGSVKTNIGHTEGAAGVAGLIKAALALHHGVVPASLHCREPNPNVAWAEVPLAIACTNQPWPPGDAPRVAGVSAFGIAGSNAHVVMEEAPQVASGASSAIVPKPGLTRSVALLPLSARDPKALQALAARYAQRLAADDGTSLHDLCWSAATRRTALSHRRAFAAPDVPAMIDTLRRFSEDEAAASAPVAATGRPRIAFVVPGQGAQWVGMAREFIEREPMFRAALERCDAAARAHVDWSILEQLALAPDSPGYRLDRIDVIQPVLVAIAIAYAELWKALGVEPDAVVGHSMGEVGAACITGVLDLEQAMHIICRRSALMRRTSGQGAMALVELSMDQARSRVAGRESEISVAVSNSPRSSVISGHPGAVEAVMADLEREGIFCRRVNVDVASHSPQMEPLAAELARELAGLRPREGGVALYSTVLARRAEPQEFSAGYWARNLRQPVLFAQTVNEMLAQGVTVFIELGPHPLLLPSIEQTAHAAGVAATTVACARRDESEQAGIAAAWGALWAAGIAIDWRRWMPQGGRRVDLPLYPWQRERLWIAAADMTTPATGPQRGHAGAAPSHPLLGHAIELGGAPAGRLWELDLHTGRSPALAAHRLHRATVLAASAYVETALAAARELWADGEACIEGLAFEQALYLNAQASPRVQLRALPDEGRFALAWHSAADGGWTRHAHAALDPAPAAAPPMAAPETSLGTPCDATALYERLAQRGAQFDPPLRAVLRAWLGDSVASATLEAEAFPRWTLPPAALDACFQLAVAAMGGTDLWMPTAVQRIRLARSDEAPHTVTVRRRETARDMVDVVLSGAERPLLWLEGVVLQRLAGDVPQDPRRWLFEPTWAETPRQATPEESAPPAARTWVLIADRAGVATALAAGLRERGAPVSVIEAEVPIERLALTPLLQRADGRDVEVVYLRATDEAEPSAASGQALWGLVQAVQQLDRYDGTARRCTLVTRGARPVQADDAASLALAQAPLWGLAAAIGEEMPTLWGGCLDLDPAEDAATQAAWLLDELAAPAVRLCARRNATRWTPQWAPVAAEPRGTRASRLRPDATYLITGGLGGVGVHVARWLIDRGARRLAILGRSPVPARAQWARLEPGSREHRAASAIRALESAGASIHAASVDVGDEHALRAFLDGFAAEGWPDIRGVVHAAGVIDDRLVAELGPDSLAAVLHGKMFGAWHLDQLLPELDHFVLFSSVAAPLAQPGQAAYAAANAFLDALAQRRHARGQPALSVNWGVWQGVGFAATAGGEQALARLSRLGIEAFPVDAGLAALGLLMKRDVAQAAVLPLDRSVLRQALSEGALAPMAAAQLAPLASTAAAPAAADASAAERFVDRLRAQDPSQRRAWLEERLAQQASAVLRLGGGRLDRRTPLGSYGLNSLMALELRNRLEADVELPLSATVLWNYPTVTALAEHLLSRLAPAPDAADTAPQTPEPAPASESLAQVVQDIGALSDADALAALASGRRATRKRP